MRKEIRRFIPLMELLKNLDSKKRSAYLKTITKDFLKFLSTVIYNVNSGIFKIPDELIKELKPYRKSIQKLSQKNISLADRKKIITSPKFFPNVISPLIPHLITLISEQDE